MRVADGYFLIKSTDVHPVSLEQERETIAQLVIQEKLSERLAGYYAGLREQYELQLDEAGFRALAAEIAAQGKAETSPSAPAPPVSDPHAGHDMHTGHSPTTPPASDPHAGHNTHQGHGAAHAEASAATAPPDSPALPPPLDPKQTLATYRGTPLTVEQCRPFIHADAPRNPEALRNYLINQLCRQVLAPLEIGKLELLKTPAIQEGLGKAKRRALIRQLQSQIAAQAPPPNSSGLRLYFEERKDRYALPAQVEVRRMNVADAQEGQGFIRQLQAGQDTLALVRRFISLSYGSGALPGDSPVARALQGPEGSFHGPFASETGYFIVQVLRRVPAQTPSFEVVQDQVAADFVQEQGNVLFQEFVKELRNRSAGQVQIDQENLQKLALLSQKDHAHE